jgi:hypothetical protein
MEQHIFLHHPEIATPGTLMPARAGVSLPSDLAAIIAFGEHEERLVGVPILTTWAQVGVHSSPGNDAVVAPTAAAAPPRKRRRKA